MAVFYGRPDSLGGLRAPLRELITTQVLENRPLNDENVNRAVEKLIEDMRPDIESACVSCFSYSRESFKVKTLSCFDGEKQCNVGLYSFIPRHEESWLKVWLINIY